MAAFLRALAATHSVSAAAASVGMSRQSAYRLRARVRGGAFDEAWDAAFHHSYASLPYAALDRAINGIEVPVYYKGEKIDSYRRFDERLTVALLRMAGDGATLAAGPPRDLAEEQGKRFAALLAVVEGEAAGDAAGEDADGAFPADPAQVSPMQDARETADFRAFRPDEAG